MSKTLSIYCYETRTLFTNYKDIQNFVKKTKVSDILKILDNPNKTFCKYHWCTDLAIFDNSLLSKGKDNIKRPIYCFETKQLFESVNAAARYMGVDVSSINRCINNPKITSCNYHWCTDLSVFDESTLVCNKSPVKQSIYCYETKEKFNNITQAANKFGINRNQIVNVLDNPSRSAANYHWCTDLELFDKLYLSKGKGQTKIAIYCYETKEKFDSIIDAKNKYNLKTNMNDIIDNPNRTAGNFHWCTDLSNFDSNIVNKSNNNIDTSNKKYKIVPVYNYETKERFDSVRQAQIHYNIGTIRQVLDNPNRTAGNFHWCTDLAIFDGVLLSIGKTITIYCYETKAKFDSIIDAAIFINLSNGSGIGKVLDDPQRTAGGYHWCTDLAIFDGVDLVYPDSGISIPEKEITDFIKSIYNKEIITNTKSIISPYELDIYLPELKLAFEFNGDYWHSEQAGKDKNYHVNKTNLCKSKGIQLIHIFEYQYRENPTIIKSMIMNKLKYNPIKLYARNCKIMQVSKDDAELFLNENHIQGFVYSNINIGLYCNNILVSIMTFGKSRFDKSIEYELLRYACLRSTNVIGGASKLLKHFEKIYKPKSLISYADISYSNGNLYNKLGFNFIGTSNPDYINIKYNIVYSRYQTMKHKLPKLLGEENFDIKLTEQQNLDNNGFLRIWKCGNLKYLKEYNYNE